MPKLNYDKLKLPYKKFRQSLSDSLEKKGGFYNCIEGPTLDIYRGYHTYDYFGPTVRRHEGQEEKNVNNDEDELSL